MRGGREGEEPVFHHREPCKFPPPTRRRFSLIADRSSCWVINVQHRQREEEGRGYVREDEEKTIQEWKRQLGVKIEGGKRGNAWNSRVLWTDRFVDLVNEKSNDRVNRVGMERKVWKVLLYLTLMLIVYIKKLCKYSFSLIIIYCLSE